MARLDEALFEAQSAGRKRSVEREGRLGGHVLRGAPLCTSALGTAEATVQTVKANLIEAQEIFEDAETEEQKAAALAARTKADRTHGFKGSASEVSEREIGLAG